MAEKSLMVLLVVCFLTPLAVFGQPALGMVKKARVEADYVLLPLADIVGKRWEGGGVKPFRAQGLFTGKTRNMPDERKAALDRWANAFAGNPDQYIRDFQSEMEVADGGAGYWLGVREKDLKAQKAILVASAPLDILLIVVGNDRDPLAGIDPGEAPKKGELFFLIEGLRKGVP